MGDGPAAAFLSFIQSRPPPARFPGTTEPSPHAHEQHVAKPKILNTILDHIGDTPLVRINKIARAEGIQVRGDCVQRGASDQRPGKIDSRI